MQEGNEPSETFFFTAPITSLTMETPQTDGIHLPAGRTTPARDESSGPATATARTTAAPSLRQSTPASEIASCSAAANGGHALQRTNLLRHNSASPNANMRTAPGSISRS